MNCLRPATYPCRSRTTASTVSRFPRAATVPSRGTMSLSIRAVNSSGVSRAVHDLDFVEWLTRNSVPFVIVFTKTDRGMPEAVSANIAAFTACIAGWFEKLPEIFQCSAMTRQGRGELLGVISATLDAGPAEEPEPTLPTEPLLPEIEPPFTLRVRSGNEPERTPRGKKRLKSTRPW